MKEVEQEFLVTKTIQEVEVERELSVNFVGVYITSEDKVSNFTRSFQSISGSLTVDFLLATNRILSKFDGFPPEERADGFYYRLRPRVVNVLSRELRRKGCRRRCENSAEVR